MRILLACLTLLLSACGFQLRGSHALPFETLHIAASTSTRVVATAAEAQATLIVLGDLSQKKIMSLNSAGRVREYQLERTFVFMVANAAGQQFVPQSTIRITREMTFDDAAVLSKQAEETLLWRDIQNDMVQQLMRRLAAAKPKPADS